MSGQELSEAANHKDLYVLKRSLDLGGQGVFIGRNVEEVLWNSTLKKAKDNPGASDWVIQEFYPSMRSKSFHLDDKELTQLHTSFGCFLFCGRSSGFLIRSSTEETTNVGRQGFVQPALVID
jgi:hypothetical protein